MIRTGACTKSQVAVAITPVTKSPRSFGREHFSAIPTKSQIHSSDKQQVGSLCDIEKMLATQSRT